MRQKMKKHFFPILFLNSLFKAVKFIQNIIKTVHYLSVLCYCFCSSLVRDLPRYQITFKDIAFSKIKMHIRSKYKILKVI